MYFDFVIILDNDCCGYEGRKEKNDYCCGDSEWRGKWMKIEKRDVEIWWGCYWDQNTSKKTILPSCDLHMRGFNGQI